jgi:predicted KAP-like P-loop ATPase
MSILPDQATTHDRLRFDDFRAALSDAITTSDPPVTIGVFGDWGSGKTSMMRMLKKELDDAGHHRTVWFDAWKFSD